MQAQLFYLASILFTIVHNTPITIPPVKELKLATSDVAPQVYKNYLIGYNKNNPYLPFQKINVQSKESLPIAPPEPIKVSSFLIEDSKLIYHDNAKESIYKVDLKIERDNPKKTCNIKNVKDMIIADKSLLILTENGQLFSCDTNTGKLSLLSSHLGSATSIEYNKDNKLIYFSSGGNKLYQLNYNNHKVEQLKKLNEIKNVKCIKQIIKNKDHIFVIAKESNKVFQFDCTGKFVKEIKTKFTALESISIMENQLIIGGKANELVDFQVLTI